MWAEDDPPTSFRLGAGGEVGERSGRASSTHAADQLVRSQIPRRGGFTTDELRLQAGGTIARPIHICGLNPNASMERMGSTWQDLTIATSPLTVPKNLSYGLARSNSSKLPVGHTQRSRRHPSTTNITRTRPRHVRRRVKEGKGWYKYSFTIKHDDCKYIWMTTKQRWS